MTERTMAATDSQREALDAVLEAANIYSAGDLALALSRADHTIARGSPALDMDVLRETVHAMKWCKDGSTMQGFAHGDEPEDDQLRARFAAEYARGRWIR